MAIRLPLRTQAIPIPLQAAYTATLTVTDGDGLQDQESVQIAVNDPDASAIASFTLIDATSDTDLFDLTNGLQIDPSVVQGIDLSIRTNTNPPVIGSVLMVLSDLSPALNWKGVFRMRFMATWSAEIILECLSQKEAIP